MADEKATMNQYLRENGEKINILIKEAKQDPNFLSVLDRSTSQGANNSDPGLQPLSSTDANLTIDKSMKGPDATSL